MNDFPNLFFSFSFTSFFSSCKHFSASHFFLLFFSFFFFILSFHFIFLFSFLTLLPFSPSFSYSSVVFFLPLFFSFFYSSFSLCRNESQVFKSKFPGWDDVLAVDYTKRADQIYKKPAIQKVSSINAHHDHNSTWMGERSIFLETLHCKFECHCGLSFFLNWKVTFLPPFSWCLLNSF